MMLTQPSLARSLSFSKRWVLFPRFSGEPLFVSFKAIWYDRNETAEDFYRGSGVALGSFSRMGNKWIADIKLNIAYLVSVSEQQVLSVLYHEMVHALQYKDMLATKASVEMLSAAPSSMYAYRLSEHESVAFMLMLSERMKKNVESIPALEELADQLAEGDYSGLIKNGILTEDHWDVLQRYAEEIETEMRLRNILWYAIQDEIARRKEG